MCSRMHTCLKRPYPPLPRKCERCPPKMRAEGHSNFLKFHLLHLSLWNGNRAGWHFSGKAGNRTRAYSLSCPHGPKSLPCPDHKTAHCFVWKEKILFFLSKTSSSQRSSFQRCCLSIYLCPKWPFRRKRPGVSVYLRPPKGLALSRPLQMFSY